MIHPLRPVIKSGGCKTGHERTRHLLPSVISTELLSTAQRKSRLADLRLMYMCMVEME